MNLPRTAFTRSTAAFFAAALPLSGAEPASPPVEPPPPVVAEPAPAPSPAPAAEPVAPSDAAAAALPVDPVAGETGPAEEPSLLVPPGAVPAPVNPGAGPSRNFSVNLLRRLVERGALTQKDAEELILLSDADVATASAPAAPAPTVPAPAPLPDEVRVTYVPETVRNRIRDEVRDQLREEAKAEGWLGGKKSGFEWPDKVEPFADIRIRYEYLSLPEGNDNTGAFPNFNAINTGEPFDVAGTQFSPQYNTDQDRNRARLRFRFGAELDIEDDFTIGFRVGTGQDNSPVSANQTLGGAGGGQGGNFSKYQLWLDRAFIGYEPNDTLHAWLGRFDNPFFSTTTIWSDELGFDGLAVRLSPKVNDSFRPYLTGGVFPIFNTELNFSSNQPAKFESIDKWLYAVQAGADLKLTKDLKAKLGVAYYQFENIEGELSDPYTPLTKSDAGNTDGSRPAFAQKGNTYRPIRNITPSVINNFGTSYQYQYFGLATPFKVVTATGRLDYDGFEPVRVSLLGEYAKNTAFDQQAINKVAVNNRGPSGGEGVGEFAGDDSAWFLNLSVGHAALDKRGNWNAYAGYRWVGSDAVVDGFNDQNFGGGGTNMKGFTVGGSVALSPRVFFGMRWFGADEIAGPPLKSDILMLDLTAKF